MELEQRVEGLRREVGVLESEIPATLLEVQERLVREIGPATTDLGQRRDRAWILAVLDAAAIRALLSPVWLGVVVPV